MLNYQRVLDFDDFEKSLCPLFRCHFLILSASLHLRLLLRKQGSLFCAQHVLHSFLYRFGIAIIRPMIIQQKLQNMLAAV